MSKQLIKLVAAGDLQSVIELIESGLSPDTENENAETLLIIAVKNRRVPVVRYLLTCNADIELTDKNGNTALWWALTEKNREIVTILAEKGANFNVKNKTNKSLLDMFIQPRKRGHLTGHTWKILEIFVIHGANIKSKEFARKIDKVIGRSYLTLQSDLEWNVVRLLIENGLNIKEVNCFNHLRWTPSSGQLTYL